MIISYTILFYNINKKITSNDIFIFIEFYAAMKEIHLFMNADKDTINLEPEYRLQFAIQILSLNPTNVCNGLFSDVVF